MGWVADWAPSESHDRFATKKMEPSIRLWVLFLAVQFLDVLGPVVLFGIEIYMLMDRRSELRDRRIFASFWHSLTFPLESLPLFRRHGAPL